MNYLIILELVVVSIVLSIILYQYILVFLGKTRKGDILLHGKAIKVSEMDHTAQPSLDIEVSFENKRTLNIHQNFSRAYTLRWLLQKKPTVGQEIYFYCNEDEFLKIYNKHKDRESDILSVYGISPEKECSKSKKIYDLLDDCYKRTILLKLLIGVLVMTPIFLRHDYPYNESLMLINMYVTVSLWIIFVLITVIL